MCARLRGCLVRKEGLPRQEVQCCQPGGGGSLSEHGPPAQLLNGPPAVRTRLEMTPIPYRSKDHTNTEKSLLVTVQDSFPMILCIVHPPELASFPILTGSSITMSSS